MRVDAGVARPVDLAHEVAEDGVGPAREYEQYLGQIGRGDRWCEALEMHGGHATRRQVARSEAFDNDVAQPTSGDGRESAGLQRDLVQLIRRHPGRPQVQERLGLISNKSVN